MRLAAILGVDAAALERDHEPYLLRLGLITLTPHGRALDRPRAVARRAIPADALAGAMGQRR